MRGLDPGGFLTSSLPRGLLALGLQPLRLDPLTCLPRSLLTFDFQSRRFDPLSFLHCGLVSNCGLPRDLLALSLLSRRFDPLSFLPRCLLPDQPLLCGLLVFGFHSRRLDPPSFLPRCLLSSRRLPYRLLTFGFHLRCLDPLSFLLRGLLASCRLPYRLLTFDFHLRCFDPLSFLLRGLLASCCQPSGLLTFGFQSRNLDSLRFLAGGLLLRCLLLGRHPPRRLLMLSLQPRNLGPCRFHLRYLPLRPPLRTIERANFIGWLVRFRVAPLLRRIACIAGRRPLGPWTRGTWRHGDHGRWHRWGGGNSQPGLLRPLRGNHYWVSDRQGRRAPGGLGARRRLRSCGGSDFWPWLELWCPLGPCRRPGLRRHRLGSRGLGRRRSVR